MRPQDETLERPPIRMPEADAGPAQKVFLFGVRRDRVEEAAQESGVPVNVVNELRVADVVLTTKTHYRRGSRVVRAAEEANKPVYVLRKNTAPHVQQFLRARGGANGPDSKVDEALQEAHDAAQRVMGRRRGLGHADASSSLYQASATYAGGQVRCSITQRRSRASASRYVSYARSSFRATGMTRRYRGYGCVHLLRGHRGLR